MNRHDKNHEIAVSLTVLLLCSAGAHAAARGRRGQPSGPVAVTWSPHAGWKGRHIYLGPTGARGWLDGSRIHVQFISKGSPADGVLHVGDVIVGAGGKSLADWPDPRRVLGNAITAAEEPEGKGRLTLSVERDGEAEDVLVRIRALGKYSETWPFKCAKSKKILDQACKLLARGQYPDGHLQGELGMATSWGGLLLLASGDPKYLDAARRAAYSLAEQPYAGIVLNAWPAGYGGLYLAEYYLATGDRSVLPKLQELATLIAEGQMACGSWGHSIPWGGYGAVNQVGEVCLIALILAAECGVKVDEAAIRKSALFFLKYAGKGSVPYGDHKPWMGEGGNGKDALAAVIFRLLGKEPEALDYFSRIVAAGYRSREEGHTGCYFSLWWGPIAAISAGEQRFRRFLDYQKWYYDLARTHDGGITCQPNAENLSGRTPGTYTWCGGEYTTGGMGLLYAMPRKKLRILGAGRSVFGRKLTGPLAEARKLYEQRQWSDLRRALAALGERKDLPAEQKRLADQLAEAATNQRRSVALTLEAIDSNVREADVYRAAEQLKSLERLLGKDDPRLAEAQELMAKNEQWIETGREYYKAWSALRDFTWQYWHHYGRLATTAMEEVVPPLPRQWETLAATSEDQPQTWRAHQWGEMKADPPTDDALPEKLRGFGGKDFDDSKWTAMAGPISDRAPKGKPAWKTRHILLRRTFAVERPRRATLRVRLGGGRDCVTEVYLNGTKVLQAVRGPSRGYEGIELSPAAARLLVKGDNVLAVHCRRGERLGRPLDVGLERAR